MNTQLVTADKLRIGDTIQFPSGKQITIKVTEIYYHYQPTYYIYCEDMVQYIYSKHNQLRKLLK